MKKMLEEVVDFLKDNIDNCIANTIIKDERMGKNHLYILRLSIKWDREYQTVDLYKDVSRFLYETCKGETVKKWKEKTFTMKEFIKYIIDQFNYDLLDEEEYHFLGECENLCKALAKQYMDLEYLRLASEFAQRITSSIESDKALSRFD